jgi:hypothetical protein
MITTMAIIIAAMIGPVKNSGIFLILLFLKKPHTVLTAVRGRHMFIKIFYNMGTPGQEKSYPGKSDLYI